MLLDANNSPQIPPDKRIDLSLDLPTKPDELYLDIDEHPSAPKLGKRSYKKLVEEVPHAPFASARERFPDLVADLDAGRDSPADPNQGMPHPPSFLTADDIDNYHYEIDMRYAKRRAAAIANNGGSADAKQFLLPTLAPVAAMAAKDKDGTLLAVTPPSTTTTIAARDLMFRNPTSVYNWLRRNAPKTFLQDGEVHPDVAGADDHAGGQEHGHGRSAAGARGGGGRSARGGAHAERGQGGKASARGKKTAPATARSRAKDKDKDTDDAMDVDEDGAASIATPTDSKKGGGGGKRKRVVDEDVGYRPKGGSSRPAKKKKKTMGPEGDPAATPTASGPKKARKSAAVAEKEVKQGGDGDDDGDGYALTARSGED